ncbi:hypothetical protein ACU686_26490 [Yinghuangia aomiensis]
MVAGCRVVAVRLQSGGESGKLGGRGNGVRVGMRQGQGAGEMVAQQPVELVAEIGGRGGEPGQRQGPRAAGFRVVGAHLLAHRGGQPREAGQHGAGPPGGRMRGSPRCPASRTCAAG